MKKLSLLILASIGIALLFYATVALQPTPVAAQQGSQTDQRDTGIDPERFWKFLQDAQYRNWAPWSGQDDDFYEGTEPHGALLKLYVNRAAAGRPENPPDKSILVKENYTPDKKLAAITVMYRARGFDPEHGDWWWVKYNPDGTVDTQNGAKLAGQVQGCIRCHSAAGGDDFIYANDRQRN